MDVVVETTGKRPEVVIDAVDGIEVVRIVLVLPETAVPKPLSVSFRTPLVDAHGLWRPESQPERLQGQTLEPPWESFQTSAAIGAPIACVYGIDGSNRVTFACSDACNPLTLSANVDEETGELVCAITFFDVPMAPLDRYEAELRVDRRSVPYYEAIDAVRVWWERWYPPAPIPRAAREPVYSTWYAFHLDLTAEAVEAQCRLARDMGCGVVIVDDGWQTDTVARGYASTGDWRPTPAKFPDLRGHVERLQALGLAVMLWFAVPFVGERSAVWRLFEGKLLAYEPHGWDGVWGVLDPRFPEVRAAIVETYERALRDWGLDGIKLDFLDELRLRETDTFGGTRDTDSVVDALEAVLEQIATGLRANNPDALVEVRQTSTGPFMRRFATMMRAYDCPNDALENRIRTLTLRLLAGHTPVHSDMLMWHRDDTPESAALQLLSVLFSVPQISVRIDELSDAHRELLRFWLSFWLEHRNVLLDGRLRPLQPQAGYALVVADDREELVAAAYATELVALPHIPARAYLINATGASRLVLELKRPWSGTLRSRDCCGRLLCDEAAELPSGVTSLAVARSGLLELLA
jgi:alpha-galactosidase